MGSRETPRGWGEGGEASPSLPSGTLAALPALPSKRNAASGSLSTFTALSGAWAYLNIETRGSPRLGNYEGRQQPGSWQKTEAARLTYRSELCVQVRVTLIFVGGKLFNRLGEKMGF